MKISYTKAVLLAALLSSSNIALAGPNNGYTTAANVYSGSSSRGWYGGGVAHVLAGWKAEADAKSKPAAVTEPVSAEPTKEAPAPVKAEEPVTETESSAPAVVAAVAATAVATVVDAEEVKEPKAEVVDAVEPKVEAVDAAEPKAEESTASEPEPEKKAEVTTTAAPSEVIKVFFESGSTTLPTDLDLSSIVSAVKSNDKLLAIVSGYNDPSGSAEKNAEISKERAKSVAKYLQEAGLSEDSIKLEKPAETKGSGSDNEARRVEVSTRMKES